MPLNKSKGNMYEWVTHTHSHLGGECPHRCSYCYVDNPRFGRPQRYVGKVRLIEKEFGVSYGEGRTIFIENCNDLFADAISEAFVLRILSHCRRWPNNTYVFQTKNPARLMAFNAAGLMPPSIIVGCTIETNRDVQCSQAPHPIERAFAMSKILHAKKFITIEPVLDFDVEAMVSFMVRIGPAWVNVGADSKGRGLPEPSGDKVRELLKRLKEENVDVRIKSNLYRLLRREPPGAREEGVLDG